MSNASNLAKMMIVAGGLAVSMGTAPASATVPCGPSGYSSYGAGNPCAPVKKAKKKKAKAAKANPCAANPCAANPCKANPCKANPCKANPCKANPCKANPCKPKA